MQTQRYISLLAAVLAVLGLAVVTAPGANAASGPVFTVMNTSETPPDGVWFRNSPHTSDTDRVTGHGVYMNEQVQLQCYAWGDAVGPHNDMLWYYTLDVTRPTNAGITNEGMLNAHYVDDGKAANQLDGGVPACVNNRPPAASTTPVATLAQGPAAARGYRYDVKLSGFAANSTVTVTCYDSASTGGFHPFLLTTDGSGSASTQSYCYSGDGPDHWVVAGGVTSNHVSWTGNSFGGGTAAGGGGSTTTGGSGNDGGNSSSANSGGVGSSTTSSTPEQCPTFNGVQSPAQGVSEWLLGRFEGGYASTVVIPWSYFSGNPQFVKEAQSIPVGQQVIGWRAVFPSDMYFALGHFTIKHVSPQCYSMYDLYDFSKVELPFWLQQRLHSAIPFELYSSGRL